ncbi:MAG: hypothetical protein OHK0013_28810 [Sandaracinaceae bacterium]
MSVKDGSRVGAQTAHAEMWCSPGDLVQARFDDRRVRGFEDRADPQTRVDLDPCKPWTVIEVHDGWLRCLAVHSEHPKRVWIQDCLARPWEGQ